MVSLPILRDQSDRERSAEGVHSNSPQSGEMGLRRTRTAISGSRYSEPPSITSCHFSVAETTTSITWSPRVIRASLAAVIFCSTRSNWRIRGNPAHPRFVGWPHQVARSSTIDGTAAVTSRLIGTNRAAGLGYPVTEPGVYRRYTNLLGRRGPTWPQPSPDYPQHQILDHRDHCPHGEFQLGGQGVVSRVGF